MTISPRWARRIPVAAVAGLALLTGCTANSAQTPVHTASTPPAPTPAGSAATADLDTAAIPALDLVQRYVPAGYATKPVVSGYDWATHTGQAIEEDALAGPHVFQIACSGNGEVSAVIRLAKKETSQHVSCGKGISVPFAGPLDAVINGSPGNTGVVAWRVLARS